MLLSLLYSSISLLNWNNIWVLLFIVTKVCRSATYQKGFRQPHPHCTEDICKSREIANLPKVTQPELRFCSFSFFFNSHLRICTYWYFFIEREKERNINVREKYRLVASCTCPDWGSNSQPRYVPWPGIERATLWLRATLCSNQLSHPARKRCCFGCLTLKCNLFLHLKQLRSLMYRVGRVAKNCKCHTIC